MYKISILLLISLFISCNVKSPRLNCSVTIKNLELQIQEIFDANFVQIRTVVLKEEIYFPKLEVIEVQIYNPTCQTLDFKTLNSKRYFRFENYEELEKNLKFEAKPIFDEILKSCNLIHFDQVCINFTKVMDNRNLDYSIGCVFKLS